MCSFESRNHANVCVFTQAPRWARGEETVMANFKTVNDQISKSLQFVGHKNKKRIKNGEIF